jgi:Rad3-related DNA helicase
MPDRFESWRKYQTTAIQDIQEAFEAGERFVGVCLPAGGGKTLVYQMVRRLAGWRGVVLTATKGLQDQVVREFGLDDVRGRVNYQCTDPDFKGMNCDEAKIECRGMCEYDIAEDTCAVSDNYATNYAYWMKAVKQDKRTSKVDLLVCDEAHKIEGELEREVGFEFQYTNQPKSADLEVWKDWCAGLLPNLRDQLKHSLRLIKSDKQLGLIPFDESMKRVAAMQRQVDKMAGLLASRDMVYEQQGKKVKWVPVWPGEYSGKIWGETPNVLLVSATLTRQTMDQLGVQGPLLEYPCEFPKNRCPVYWLKSGVRLNYRTPESELAKWLDCVDRVIGARLDRKGVVHTVSYERQRYVMQHSKYKQFMVGNVGACRQDFGGSRVAVGVSDVVEVFRKSDSPCVLVSPSVSMGWDFPGEQCEYQVVGKLPYPGKTESLSARCQRDGNYLNYQVMQTLAQCTRRGMRGKDDRCETFVVDDSIGWFMGVNRRLAPGWLAVRPVVDVPKKPRKLDGGR